MKNEENNQKASEPAPASPPLPSLADVYVGVLGGAQKMAENRAAPLPPAPSEPLGDCEHTLVERIRKLRKAIPPDFWKTEELHDGYFAGVSDAAEELHIALHQQAAPSASPLPSPVVGICQLHNVTYDRECVFCRPSAAPSPTLDLAKAIADNEAMHDSLPKYKQLDASPTAAEGATENHGTPHWSSGTPKVSERAAEGERPRHSRECRAWPNQPYEVGQGLRGLCDCGVAKREADRGSVQTALPRAACVLLCPMCSTEMLPGRGKEAYLLSVSESRIVHCPKCLTHMNLGLNVLPAAAPTPLSAEELAPLLILCSEEIPDDGRMLAMTFWKLMAKRIVRLPGVAVVRK